MATASPSPIAHGRGGRGGARLGPADNVARGGLSAAVAPPCPGAADARGAGAMGCIIRRTPRALAVCRTALGQAPVEVPVSLDWQTLCAQRGEAHPERCPTCGRRLVCTGVIPRGGAPAGAGWRARAMKPTHARRQGRSARGVVCLAVATWCPGAGRDAVWGAQRARSAPRGPTGRLAGLVAGGRAGVTRPKLHSASEHPVSGRIRTRSVQPSAIRSAQGRT